MHLDTYLAVLREDLARATALADDATRHTADRLTEALEPALRLVLVQAVSDAATLASAQLDEAEIVVRMDGREPVVEVRTARAPAEQPDVTAPPEDGEEGTSRITLRLPDSVKKGADAAATQHGVSLNSWITQACRRALEQHPTTSRRRVSGWA